jgi:hypothetical protein
MIFLTGITAIFHQTAAIIAVLHLYFIHCGDATKCAYFVRFSTHFMADHSTLFPPEKSTSAKEGSDTIVIVVSLG